MELELLMLIRKTPGLYLGVESVSRLGSFLDGYYMGRNDSGMLDYEDWRSFQKFIDEKLNNKKSMRWDFLLLEREVNEAVAFRRFFEFLDDFHESNKGTEEGNGDTHFLP